MGLLLPGLLIVLWEVVTRAGLLPAHWLPPPAVIVRTTYELAATGELAHHVAATLGRVAGGFAIGALAATLLGLLTGRSATLRALIDPTLQGLRSVPSLAWVPLFLLWLGIGELSKVALIAFGAFFPIYLNLLAGIQAIDPRWIEVGRVFRYERWQLARHVLIPAALPAYLTGLRSGLGLGFMFVVAAELMGASRGLGYLMVDGQTTSRPELIISALLLFALVGKISDHLLERLGARVQPHRAAV